MNKKTFITIFLLTAFFTNVNAQNENIKEVIVNQGIHLPKDSVKHTQLVSALNGFLTAVQQTNVENKWVLPSEKEETELLTDEMKDMDKCDSIDFKPYLINVESLADKKSYRLQLAYQGVDKKIPVLRAIFELIAHDTGDGFLFSSPLKLNAKDWKTKTFDYLTFHYQNTSVENLINKEVEATFEFDKLLKINTPKEVYYFDDCNDIAGILRFTGIIYKREMNGIDWPGFDFIVGNKGFSFNTQRISRKTVYDFHNTFHSRAGRAIPPEQRNNQMICGCAYIYAGCWNISWENIQKMFKEKIKYDKKTDWKKLYFEEYNFGESTAKYLLVTQYINAQIITKIEKEQGFSAVMELLASGNIHKNRENFFKILEKITGINEKNFNEKVGKLIVTN